MYSGSGFANSIKWEPANPTEQKNTADLLGLGNESSASSFGQPASRNPFGPSNTTAQQSWSSPKSGQKSLVELMQEQKQQQQANLQPQMTGFSAMQPQATGFGGMQPQSTGFGGLQPQATGFGGMQPQMTGFGGMQPQATGFGQPQQQQQQQHQQQQFSPQNAFF